MTSYEFQHVSFSGITNNVQLNLTDKTLSNKSYGKQVEILNNTKDKTVHLSSYMNTGRIVSSITNESIPFDTCLQNENTDDNMEDIAENIILDDIEIYNDDSNNGFNTNDGVVDITKEQDDMIKRFEGMKFTHSDEASMDLFHIMKSSDVPLVMFDRIIRWLKRHEGMISSIGTSGLLSRKQFIESMNKNYIMDLFPL